MASGIIIIDKPQGWTSQDVAARLRRVFGGWVTAAPWIPWPPAYCR